MNYKAGDRLRSVNLLNTVTYEPCNLQPIHTIRLYQQHKELYRYSSSSSADCLKIAPPRYGINCASAARVYQIDHPVSGCQGISQQSFDHVLSEIYGLTTTGGSLQLESVRLCGLLTRWFAFYVRHFSREITRVGENKKMARVGFVESRIFTMYKYLECSNYLLRFDTVAAKKRREKIKIS